MVVPVTGARPQILVVDDEEDVRDMIAEYLQDEGFRVHEAADGDGALAALSQNQVDLVLLDVMLPSRDGFDVLSAIRRSSEVPVILVTGRGQETDRIVGLRMGADDYVVKPFSLGELAARIRSVLRRAGQGGPQGKRLEYDGLAIDLATRDVVAGERKVDLTAKEFDLLAFLAAAPRQVFSREQLLSKVWESSSEWQDPATVTEHVRRVRHKIEADPDHPRWVCTVRGVGYRFEP